MKRFRTLPLFITGIIRKREVELVGLSFGINYYLEIVRVCARIGDNWEVLIEMRLKTMNLNIYGCF